MLDLDILSIILEFVRYVDLWKLSKASPIIYRMIKRFVYPRSGMILFRDQNDDIICDYLQDDEDVIIKVNDKYFFVDKMLRRFREQFAKSYKKLGICKIIIVESIEELSEYDHCICYIDTTRRILLLNHSGRKIMFWPDYYKVNHDNELYITNNKKSMHLKTSYLVEYSGVQYECYNFKHIDDKSQVLISVDEETSMSYYNTYSIIYRRC